MANNINAPTTAVPIFIKLKLLLPPALSPKNRPIYPPTKEPEIPINIVFIHPPGPFPGIIIFAIAPATKPKIIQAKKFIIIIVFLFDYQSTKFEPKNYIFVFKFVKKMKIVTTLLLISFLFSLNAQEPTFTWGEEVKKENAVYSIQTEVARFDDGNFIVFNYGLTTTEEGKIELHVFDKELNEINTTSILSQISDLDQVDKDNNHSILNVTNFFKITSFDLIGLYKNILFLKFDKAKKLIAFEFSSTGKIINSKIIFEDITSFTDVYFSMSPDSSKYLLAYPNFKDDLIEINYCVGEGDLNGKMTKYKNELNTPCEFAISNDGKIGVVQLEYSKESVVNKKETTKWLPSLVVFNNNFDLLFETKIEERDLKLDYKLVFTEKGIAGVTSYYDIYNKGREDIGIVNFLYDFNGDQISFEKTNIKDQLEKGMENFIVFKDIKQLQDGYLIFSESSRAYYSGERNLVTYFTRSTYIQKMNEDFEIVWTQIIPKAQTLVPIGFNRINSSKKGYYYLINEGNIVLLYTAYGARNQMDKPNSSYMVEVDSNGKTTKKEIAFSDGKGTFLSPLKAVQINDNKILTFKDNKETIQPVIIAF